MEVLFFLNRHVRLSYKRSSQNHRRDRFVDTRRQRHVYGEKFSHSREMDERGVACLHPESQTFPQKTAVDLVQDLRRFKVKNK